MRGHGLTQKIGTIVCLLYAVVWVVACFDPPPAMAPMFDYPGIGKYAPPVLTALLFAAAPLMRRDIRRMRIIVPLGIVLMISPSLLVALQGGLPLGDVTLWLIVPLGIAAWVFFGPGNPDAATDSDASPAPHPIRVRPMHPGQSLVFGIGIITLVVGSSVPGGFIFKLGSVMFGLCCIIGALVAWHLNSD